MMEQVLPPGVVVAEARADVPADRLWPGEESAVAGAALARRLEYATTRDCARRALAGLGWPAQPILRRADRTPVWPDGVIGSLTHCRGYRAAAVARQGTLWAIGIDAEPAEPLPARVLDRISSAAERTALADLTRQAPDIPWDRLLFSLKEAVFKAWYPATQRGLGFGDVEVVPRADQTADLVFRCPVPAAVAQLRWTIRWAADNGLLLTGVVAEN